MPSQPASHLKSVIGRNIATERKSRDLSQLQLAIKLGIDPITVSRWERGETAPNFVNLASLAVVYGVELAWFYVDRDKDKEAV